MRHAPALSQHLRGTHQKRGSILHSLLLEDLFGVIPTPPPPPGLLTKAAIQPLLQVFCTCSACLRAAVSIPGSHPH